MRQNELQQWKPLWPWAVLLTAVMFVIGQLIQLGWTSFALKKNRALESQSSTPTAPSKPLHTGEIETHINVIAKQTKVTRLLSINTQDSADGPQIQIEAEAPLTSMAQFLHELQTSPDMGACARIHVMASTDNLPPHVALTFSTHLSAMAPASVTAHSLQIKRNVFAALWQEQTVNANDVALAQAKKFEEQQRQEQARLQNEQQARAADELLTSKRRELQGGYTLTGIVNDGKQPIAFVSEKSSGGKALMLRQDDMVSDARVARIDEQKGEMQLDYQGKFQLLFHINEN